MFLTTVGNLNKAVINRVKDRMKINRTSSLSVTDSLHHSCCFFSHVTMLSAGFVLLVKLYIFLKSLMLTKAYFI